jgi:hypothetical protein
VNTAFDRSVPAPEILLGTGGGAWAKADPQTINAATVYRAGLMKN